MFFCSFFWQQLFALLQPGCVAFWLASLEDHAQSLHAIALVSCGQSVCWRSASDSMGLEFSLSEPAVISAITVENCYQQPSGAD